MCIFLDYLFKEMFNLGDWVVADNHFVDPEVVYEDSDFAIFLGMTISETLVVRSMG